MKPAFRICFIPLLSVLCACTGIEEESEFSVYERKAFSFRTYQGLPVYEGNDPNAKLHDRLLPNELQFEKIIEGQKIPLNSLIVMPDTPDFGFLALEFNRIHLSQTFLRALFYDKDEMLLSTHPFASLGIEPVLTDKRFILNIHPGVVLLLRSGTERSPDYKTFKNEDVVATVTKVQGSVYSSYDHEYIKIKLYDFYATAALSNDISSIDPKYVKQRSDGSYVITAPLDAYEMPVRYPPRIIEGP